MKLLSVRVVEVTKELEEICKRDEPMLVAFADCPKCTSSFAMLNNGFWNTDEQNEVKNNFCGICGQRLEW